MIIVTTTKRKTNNGSNSNSNNNKNKNKKRRTSTIKTTRTTRTTKTTRTRTRRRSRRIRSCYWCLKIRMTTTTIIIIWCHIYIYISSISIYNLYSGYHPWIVQLKAWNLSRPHLSGPVSNMAWPSLLFRFDRKAQAIQHRMFRAILHHHISEGDIPCRFQTTDIWGSNPQNQTANFRQRSAWNHPMSELRSKVWPTKLCSAMRWAARAPTGKHDAFCVALQRPPSL